MSNDDAKLKPLSHEEVQVFKNAISEKYSVLQNSRGAVDGLKPNIQE